MATLGGALHEEFLTESPFDDVIGLLAFVDEQALLESSTEFAAGHIFGSADDETIGTGDATSTADVKSGKIVLGQKTVLTDGEDTANPYDVVFTNVKTGYKMSGTEEAVILVDTGVKGKSSVTGNAKDNDILGDAANNVVKAGLGNDFVHGFAGNDTIDGEAGNDSLEGDDGNDFLIGGAGADTLVGGTGADTSNGGLDNDVIDAGLGNDSSFGGLGADSIFGGEGDDTIIGGTGNDKDSVTVNKVKFLDGDDVLFGGAGNDNIFGGTGADTLDGGTGNNSLLGGVGDDVLSALEGKDTLKGDAGNDSMSAGAGNDILDGGAGDDTIAGDTGNDSMLGGLGSDTFIIGTDSGLDYIQDFTYLKLGDKVNNKPVKAADLQEDIIQVSSEITTTDFTIDTAFGGVVIQFNDGGLVLLKGLDDPTKVFFNDEGDFFTLNSTTNDL